MTGSFNPFTLGHLSVLRRGLRLFDNIIIIIGHNANKSGSGNAAASRARELQSLLAPLGDAVEVTVCDHIVAMEAKNRGACALLRGVRSVTDYEYERNMADVNRLLTGLETVLLFAEPQLAALSSSALRELDSYGIDTSAFTPSPSHIQMIKKELDIQ